MEDFFKPHIDHLEILYSFYESNTGKIITLMYNYYIALQHVSGIEKLLKTVCLDCDSKS